MHIELQTGEKLEIVTPDSRIEIEAGGWWDADLKAPDSYTRVEVVSTALGKGAAPQYIPQSSNEASDYFIRIWVRRRAHNDAMPGGRAVVKKNVDTALAEIEKQWQMVHGDLFIQVLGNSQTDWLARVHHALQAAQTL